LERRHYKHFGGAGRIRQATTAEEILPDQIRSEKSIYEITALVASAKVIRYFKQ
jgi:hypothetical protein